MADEKIEMSEEELDGIAGGYIFDTKNEGDIRYEVIDLRGDVVARFGDLEEAKRYAYENLQRSSLNRRAWVIDQGQLYALRRKH